MSAALCHRLTAKPVSASAVSCRSHRPRKPLLVPPLAATVALYDFSNSLHEPARSLPHVIRMIMADPPSGCPARTVVTWYRVFLARAAPSGSSSHGDLKD